MVIEQGDSTLTISLKGKKGDKGDKGDEAFNVLFKNIIGDPLKNERIKEIFDKKYQESDNLKDIIYDGDIQYLTNEKKINFDRLDKLLGLNARKIIADIINPVSIVRWFANNKDLNKIYAGQKWGKFGEKCIFVSSNAEYGLGNLYNKLKFKVPNSYYTEETIQIGPVKLLATNAYIRNA